MRLTLLRGGSWRRVVAALLVCRPECPTSLHLSSPNQTTNYYCYTVISSHPLLPSTTLLGYCCSNVVYRGLVVVMLSLERAARSAVVSTHSSGLPSGLFRLACRSPVFCFCFLRYAFVLSIVHCLCTPGHRHGVQGRHGGRGRVAPRPRRRRTKVNTLLHLHS